ncbi:MAG TPA: NAD(P)H-dependent oxidoreductase, partial [Flavipsychrobacter sp.]|nr:NAD(P)H-dependent oxidoreductase [Flavipsychrobacter sp.]
MTGKKILVINGHPDAESFNHALADAYVKGAQESGADIAVIDIGTLSFSPNLQYGYRQRTELEPDLLDAQQKILWAEH